ncbi:MAG TPA: hypothetical protein VFJ58_12650 [Armatimonadota bacterium]|nr:hypothetical protein [Armatimonadota bacterium]
MKRLINLRTRGAWRRGVVVSASAAAVLGALFVGLAHAQDGPLTFAAVDRATWHTNYVGTQVTTVTGPRLTRSFDSLVVQNANGHRSVRVTRPPRRSGEMEVDDGLYRWHLLPRKRVVQLQPSEAAHHPLIDRRRQPSLSPGGPDTVAGRPTTIYTVVPLRPQAPMLKIWVDNVTSLPLRTDWDTRDGRHISEVFTNINFGTRDNVSFRWPRDAALQVHTWVGGGNKGRLVTESIPLALPRGLPANVLFDGIWDRELAGRKVLFLRFHQGRRTASIFETIGSANRQAPAGPQIDNWNLGSLNITLVSDLPPGPRARLRGSMRIVHTPPKLPLGPIERWLPH